MHPETIRPVDSTSKPREPQMSAPTASGASARTPSSAAARPEVTDVDSSGRTERVTTILGRLAEGDATAKEELWRRVYQELHRRAERVLYGRGSSLRPTELVHETFLKFERQRNVPGNRSHFRAIAATLMYRVLLDHLDSRGRRERMFVTLQGPDEPSAACANVDALALRQALERLESEDPQAARIVVYRFFGELTVRQVAAELGLTERHVYRVWRFARARLLSELSG